jgi:RNA polymerase sigma-70 factor (ECF subfamily)
MNRLGLDDAAVIEASRAEPDRFASLFDRHAPYIHRYLARRVGRQAADDLVAETFLVAFRKRAGYERRCHDARQFRLRQAAGPDPVQHDHAERAALDVTVQSIRAPLAEAVAGLAPPDRDVLLLIAWEQLSYVEVARALNIPVGTVRSRLHRARTKIREALAGTPAAATYEEILTNE